MCFVHCAYMEKNCKSPRGATIGGDGEVSGAWISTVTLVFGFAALMASITHGFSGALGEFFLQTEWTPSGACRISLCENMSFGVNSLLLTALQVAFGALIIAIPLGVGTAIYLSEYTHQEFLQSSNPHLRF